MEETKKRGRPKGSTQYDQAKVLKSHRMTPTAHEYIKAHKEKIETAAQKWIQNKL